MAENSHIQWTDHTFNPWYGCTKVSPGCANCYAETLMDTRYHKVKWGKGQARVRTKTWRDPVKWNAAAERHQDFMNGTGDRPRVFCASLADWLDDEVPIEWLADLLKLIHDTPNLDWLLLTKRPQNWKPRIEAAEQVLLNRVATHAEEFDAWMSVTSWMLGTAPQNVWIGTTVEDQTRADERIPELLKIPARVRFLSCEPLLGPVDLRNINGALCSWWQVGVVDCVDAGKLHWIISGAESGTGKRTMHCEWAESLRAQCADADIAFFMKQMEVNGKITGEIKKFPGSLQVRQFPAGNSERFSI